MKFEGTQFFVKSAEEMSRVFSDARSSSSALLRSPSAAT